MATPRSKPYVYVTWLTKLLAGETQCVGAVWVKAHFRYTKRPDPTFDLAVWTADHGALVTTRARELEREGWAVRLENENDFRLQGAVATLAGKPDVLAIRDDEVLVVDAKTGQQRHSDFWQVLIYLWALPKCFPHLPRRVRGEVLYRDHRIAVTADDVTAARIEQWCALLKTIGGPTPAAMTPSASGCRFCDVAECPDRITEDVATVTTELF